MLWHPISGTRTYIPALPSPRRDKKYIRQECEAPPDCEQACEEYAHHILEECLVEDGGEDQCEALARETFESCVVAEECGIP